MGTDRGWGYRKTWWWPHGPVLGEQSNDTRLRWSELRPIPLLPLHISASYPSLTHESCNLEQYPACGRTDKPFLAPVARRSERQGPKLPPGSPSRLWWWQDPGAGPPHLSDCNLLASYHARWLSTASQFYLWKATRGHQKYSENQLSRSMVCGGGAGGSRGRWRWGWKGTAVHVKDLGHKSYVIWRQSSCFKTKPYIVARPMVFLTVAYEIQSLYIISVHSIKIFMEQWIRAVTYTELAVSPCYQHLSWEIYLMRTITLRGRYPYFSVPPQQARSCDLEGPEWPVLPHPFWSHLLPPVPHAPATGLLYCPPTLGHVISTPAMGVPLAVPFAGKPLTLLFTWHIPSLCSVCAHLQRGLSHPTCIKMSSPFSRLLLRLQCFLSPLLTMGQCLCYVSLTRTCTRWRQGVCLAQHYTSGTDNSAWGTAGVL